jgi:hypothetical protein
VGPASVAARSTCRQIHLRTAVRCRKLFPEFSTVSFSFSPCPLPCSLQPLLDYLVSAGENWGRDRQAARRRSLHIGDQIELGWLLNGQLGGFGALPAGWLASGRRGRSRVPEEGGRRQVRSLGPPLGALWWDMCGCVLSLPDVSEIKLVFGIPPKRPPTSRRAGKSRRPTAAGRALRCQGARGLEMMRWGPDPPLGQGPQDWFLDHQRPGRGGRQQAGLPRSISAPALIGAADNFYESKERGTASSPPQSRSPTAS